MTDYGPRAEAFLAAVTTAKVIDVQRAILKVKDTNEKLAGDPRGRRPARTRRAAAATLPTGSAEDTLIPLIQTACIGTDPKCQQVVTLYADNNQKTIVPRLAELRATGLIHT